MTRKSLSLRPQTLVAVMALLAPLGACTGEMIPPVGSGGAAVGSGGAASGGGTASGGAPGSGGAASGGAASGGAASGGAASGGAASGGAASGGAPSGGSTGSGGETGDQPNFQFFRKIVTQWTNSCQGADCHGGTPAHINLVDDAGLYERVTTAVSNDVCLDENDMPMKIIVPGEPENSALIKILKGPCENEGRMPGGSCTDPGDCLTPDLIALLEEWIENGALEN